MYDVNYLLITLVHSNREYDSEETIVDEIHNKEGHKEHLTLDLMKEFRIDLG